MRCQMRERMLEERKLEGTVGAVGHDEPLVSRCYLLRLKGIEVTCSFTILLPTPKTRTVILRHKLG